MCHHLTLENMSAIAGGIHWVVMQATVVSHPFFPVAIVPWPVMLNSLVGIVDKSGLTATCRWVIPSKAKPNVAAFFITYRPANPAQTHTIQEYDHVFIAGSLAS